MKRLKVFLGLTALGLLAACGGSRSSSSNTTNPTSKIAQRVFVSNKSANILHIIDAQKDVLSGSAIGIGLAPTMVLETPDKKTTLVYNSGSKSISVVDNATETFTASLNLPDFTDSIVVSPDSHTMYVAVRNAGAPTTNTGSVQVFNLTSTATAPIAIAVTAARHLALTPDGSKLLVFSDDPSPAANSIYVIATSGLTASTTATAIPGFDRPVTAVFGASSDIAYIINCGPECGGAQASVISYSLIGNIADNQVNVSAAREALLSGSALYVAGTTTNGAGLLNVIDTVSLTITKPNIAIANGTHDTIALGSNGQLFIGSRGCSFGNSGKTGCLSIFNTSASSVTFSVLPQVFSNDDITGIEPIPGRNVVYVCEGGELRIYSTMTDALQTTVQVDIVGTAVDLREVF